MSRNVRVKLNRSCETKNRAEQICEPKPPVTRVVKSNFFTASRLPSLSVNPSSTSAVMSDTKSHQPANGSTHFSGLANTVILGIFIVLAAASHSLLSSSIAATVPPLHVDTVIGEIHVREQGGVVHHKCNGFRIECHESFVVIYVDKQKEPTWTTNVVLIYPWSRIEHLTMAGRTSDR